MLVVHNTHGGEGIQCAAVFSVVNSSVSTLSFENCGAVLAVGFECGQVSLSCTSCLFVEVSKFIDLSTAPSILKHKHNTNRSQIT